MRRDPSYRDIQNIRNHAYASLTSLIGYRLEKHVNALKEINATNNALYHDTLKDVMQRVRRQARKHEII